MIPITNDLEANLGTPYAGTGSLDLIDALGNTITASKLPMGKKIRLQVSISGGECKLSWKYLHLFPKLSTKTERANKKIKKNKLQTTDIMQLNAYLIF